MLIFDAESNPVIFDSLTGPIVPEHMWILDIGARDFMLAPITMIEETICPTMIVSINGFRFPLPAFWNILIYDRDTSQLDVVDAASASGHDFTALVYGPKRPYPTPGRIIVEDYLPEYKNIGPALSKQQMLCHPISQTEWVSVGPADVYKHLRDIIVGDLMV